MGTSLLANMLLADSGAMQAPLRAAAPMRRRHSPAARATDPPTTNAPRAATPDNPRPPAKRQRTHRPSEDFSRTLDNKMRPRTPQNAQATRKGKKPESGSAPEAVQAVLSCPVVLDKATIAGADAKLGQQIPGRTLDKSAPLTATAGPLKAPPVILPAAKLRQQIPSRAPHGSATLAAPSGPLKAPPVILPGAKPLTTKPDQAVPDTEPTTDAHRGNSQLIAPAMSGAQSHNGAGSGHMQVSDRAFAPKELLPDAAARNQGETIAGRNPVTTDEPALSPHAQVEPSGKHAEVAAPAKAVITSLHSARANQPADSSTAPPEHLLAPKAPSTPGNSATQLSNKPFVAPDDQASRSPQSAPIRSENPSQAAEHAISGKAGIDHKGLLDKTQLPAVQQKNTVHVGTVSVKSIARKAGQPGTGSFSSQADNPGSLLSSRDGHPNAESGEQALVGNTAPADITEQSPASAESARPPANAGSRPAVAEQIMESVRTSLSAGSRQIVIQLNPPELGKVSITFREDADGITGLLQVDEPQTRHQLQQALPEIIQNLQNSGVQIKRLEVQLTDQHQQYNPKDQSAATGQDGWSGQHSSPNFQSQRDNTSYNEWLTNIDPAPEFTEARVQFADNSINMLV